ncbi:DUF6169 family protein [Runella sp.]|jgi:hypothetical protein|uniref:DUF6169 family protein n=1 Tax=Runella sp. TaxID=1960881 RepID=UPI00301659B0
MQNEEFTSPNQRYSFNFLGGTDNIYSFQTKNEFAYEILFRPTPYLFGINSINSKFIYELIIRVARNNSSKKSPPFDQLVSPTIAEIFTNFYENAPKTIVIYICDSSDNRQLIRQAKFSRWFEYFDKNNFTKLDDSIRDSGGIIYPVSLIVKSNNPHKKAILLDFLEMIEGYNRNK